MIVKKIVKAKSRLELSKELLRLSLDGYMPVTDTKIVETGSQYRNARGDYRRDSDFYFCIQVEKEVHQHS